MTPLLDLLDEADRRQVVTAAARRKFRKGDTLFHAGDPGDTLHMIVRGHVAIRLDTALGDTATLAVLGPGASFGEQAFLVPDGRRTASAVALDPVETLALHRDEFEALRARNPRVDRLLVAVLAEQVRRLTAQVVDARHASVPTRVARVLRDLLAVWDHGQVPIEIPLTQDDVASLTGATRPTVNRALQGMATDGVIELARGRLLVHRPDTLQRLAR